MSEPSAVQRAVDLLTSRLAEARQGRDALTTEILTIENALGSLSVYTNAAVAVELQPEPVAPAESAVHTAGTMSVRAAVKAILDSEDRAFAPVEIRGLVATTVMNGKTNQQRTNSVRTALWSLRQKGEAAMVDETHTKSTKWLTPNPELPADGGEGTALFEGGVL